MAISSRKGTMTVHPVRAISEQSEPQLPLSCRYAPTEPVHNVSSEEAGRTKNGRGITWSRVSGGLVGRAGYVFTSKRGPMAQISLFSTSREFVGTHLPPDTVRMGLPVRVILTSWLRYRRVTVGRLAARGVVGIWAVNAAPERAQRRGEAIVGTFNGCLMCETQA